MKVGTAVLVAAGVWTAYELYRHHTVNGALSSMKAEIAGIKNKMMKKEEDKTSSTTSSSTSSASCAVVSSGTSLSTPQVAALGGSNWGNFVGQPIFQDVIVPNNPKAVINRDGYDYYSVFRKKPTAFSAFTGWN